MKLKTRFKKIITGVLIGCLLLSNVGYAMGPSNTNAGVTSLDSEYLHYGRISFARLTGQLEIKITTKAVENVTHIYHDVTIYKNGSLYCNLARYEDWSAGELITPITISAKSGDYFDVYVDHYTDQNGYVEYKYSHQSYTY